MHAALVAPACNRTWEALTRLNATDDETDTVVVSFPRPARIVAVYPSISPVALTAGLQTPTLDDILVEISINEETRLTNRFDVVSQPSGTARVMVTMGSFRDTTGGARVLDINLPDKTNELVIRFRWKSQQPVPPAAAQYRDVVLGMAFHAVFDDEKGLA
jgi:hypothetical protein